MLVLELKHIVKRMGERTLLSMDRAQVYAGDRIGVVGANGEGKTTLLEILAGRREPDEGWVRRRCGSAFIAQSDEQPDCSLPDAKIASEFSAGGIYRSYMSGGEKTRLRIVQALSAGAPLLFADEPTANLDLGGIRLLEKKLADYPGTLLIVSHDRELLDRLCGQIWEVASGRVTIYRGGYSAYLRQKEAERERQQAEYEQYRAEKARLQAALREKTGQSAAVRRTPARMGNSEARLHKMGDQRAKANLEQAAKALRSRLEHLTPAERPQTAAAARLDLAPAIPLHSRVLVSADDLNKACGGKVLFDHARFSLPNGRKTALIGDNGCGKTTLLQMIQQGEAGIRLAHGLTVAYQHQELVRGNRSVLEYVTEGTERDANFVRLILARLLFRGDAVYKSAAVLSGGEKIRVALARLILSTAHLLILDEPTNYLDIPSMQAVETVLAEYEGNLLFASHDRRFIRQVANRLMIIQSGKITEYDGGYDAYLAGRNRDGGEAAAERMVLERRISELLGRLSAPGKKDDPVRLDQEYRAALGQLRQLSQRP